VKKKNNSALSKGFIINEAYKVLFFLKKGNYAETYRVKDKKQKTLFLKLFDYSLLHKTQFTNDNDILEIELLKKIKHANITKFIDSGELNIEGKKYAYAVLEFISGETLADRLKREECFNPYFAKSVMLGVLNGLNYLHKLDNPIIHNEVTNLNVMLDLSGEVKSAKLINFGYARYFNQSHKSYLKEALNPFYLANESFNKIFTPQSDVFSAGALYYHLLFGLPPWFFDTSKYETADVEEAIINERRKPLKIMSGEYEIDTITISILTKALHPRSSHRFQNITEFISALNGEKIKTCSDEHEELENTDYSVGEGKGFSAIAGMQKLKETIQLDIINALHDKALYAEYGLTIPNGMLLYGPPGCGKTFFAEKMAEEVGFNFFQIKPSDIQSKWVNASQENIKKLFDEAKEKAPSIIFIDELDALVPSRDNDSVNHMNTSAVNEFLAQMNNCGKHGIFVIGATNRPNAIDSAILRTGRLDKRIYLPPPDFEARKLMFELYLKKRPIELGLSFDTLSKLTHNFVSSDIKFLCDEASRQALKTKIKISLEILKDTINDNSSSLSLEDLNAYTEIKATMANSKNTEQRKKIGFI